MLQYEKCTKSDVQKVWCVNMCIVFVLIFGDFVLQTVKSSAKYYYIARYRLTLGGKFLLRFLAVHVIGSILNLFKLAGKISQDTRKNGKGAKTGASDDWRSFYLSPYDWQKGSHMTKVVFFFFFFASE